MSTLKIIEEEEKKGGRYASDFLTFYRAMRSVTRVEFGFGIHTPHNSTRNSSAPLVRFHPGLLRVCMIQEKKKKVTLMTTDGREMSIKQFQFQFMMDKGGARFTWLLVDSSSRWKVTTGYNC
jgi:hypothetical protein